MIGEIDALAEERGSSVFAIVFQLLTDLDLSADIAEEYWRDCVAHYREMRQALGRDLSLRAALVDYLCMMTNNLCDAKVISLNQYETLVSFSRKDFLTGLYNRRFFFEMFQREVARAERYGSSLSYIFFDIDDFKKVNDRFGHACGDQVLQEVARVIMKNKRQEDIAGRYGGEELVLLLPDTGKREALVLGERIRHEVEEAKVSCENASVSVTVSGGLAAFPYDATDAANLQHDADAALYRAKGSGKNSIVLFSENMRRYVRVPYEDDILIGEMELTGTRLSPGRSRNISGSGLLVEHDRPFSVGSTVQARLALRKDAPFMVAGSVSWVRPNRQRPGYAMGVSLIETDKKINKEILYYILNRLSSPDPSAGAARFS